METLKQDLSKLYSITEYAKKMGVTRQTIYNWILDKEKKINLIEISGRQYIKFPS